MAKKMTSQQDFSGILIDNAPIALCIWDMNENLLRINRWALDRLGYQAEEILGQKWQEKLFHADGIAFLRAGIRGGQNGLAGQGKEIRIYQPDGSGVDFLWNYQIIQDNNKEEKIVLFGADMTKIKQQEKSQSLFLSNMSHEIKTPLNGIIGMTDLLLETEITSEQQELLEILKSCSHHQLQMINNILDLSKIESGRFTLNNESFDSMELFRSVKRMAVSLAAPKGLTVQMEIDREVPRRLWGDPLRLEEVLINLLSNGVKFTETGSVSLVVSLEEKNCGGCLLRFSVSDTGMGIANEKIPELFEPFRQLDPTIFKKYGGSGLGLAIVKELVKMMQGEINVHSQPGQGSRFSFTASFKIPVPESETSQE